MLHYAAQNRWAQSAARVNQTGATGRAAIIHCLSNSELLKKAETTNVNAEVSRRSIDNNMRSPAGSYLAACLQAFILKGAIVVVVVVVRDPLIVIDTSQLRIPLSTFVDVFSYFLVSLLGRISRFE